ncbi:TIGR03503 family protein [Vibrio tapetis]|uniref:TIGR03503 family protein n=1 Tax=Vibrio tapetis subsp. tapetis TaxID=1671868 RepID=A0A2N8ZEL1_9VIBR|nr:TIGR03503 family protein [Vibrio tapetis]SON50295.1 conserved exported protein of unknown function [Vibrio tapetis subsp. tapetis]
MLRILLCLCVVLLSCVSRAETETTQSLLDNRFRIDSTISQASFVIYRKKRSQSVVLVRPDGTKYYAWQHPENVRWYEEPGMDIISIDDPMRGPWQAIGKVHPKNNIKIISNLTLNVDSFPQRLYMDESLKFSARLEQNGAPLNLRDFLERVNLNVTFTKYLENEASLSADARPIPQVLGTFEDDGRNLDEVAGDGNFTVELPIDIEPGKYRARVTSGNGVFLRAVEQVVLVYPPPLTAAFAQARSEDKEHNFTVTGEEGVIAPGSIAVTVEQTSPDGLEMITQGQSEKAGTKAYFALPNNSLPGKHTWSGSAYATEAATGRELVFHFREQSFSIVEKVDVEKSMEAFKKAQEEKRLLEEKELREIEREEERFNGMLILIIGNIAVFVIGLIVWFVMRKIKMKRQQIPEMQLSMPPKD